MFIIYIFVIIINLYYMMLLLQEGHYHYDSYLIIVKRFIKRKYSYLLLLPLVTLIEETIIINISICLICMIYILMLLLEKHIVKLKFTPRVIRLFIFCLLINLLIGFVFYKHDIKFVYLLYLTEIILLISQVLLTPVEALINKYYMNKAKKKIESINPLIIGITGSAGKTSCKHYLYQMLKDKYITFMTPKSYNTVLGISKSINHDMNKFTEVAIIEFGASHKGDIKKSLRVARPNISLITNISIQHLETFKTVDNIIKEKCLLMESSDVHFYNVNSKYKLSDDKKLYSFGLEKDVFIDSNLDNKIPSFYSSNIRYDKNGTRFDFHEKDKCVTFETSLLGENNVINITSSIAICRYLGLDFDYLKTKVKLLMPVNARLEIIKRGNRVIINDSFNSNKNGFIEALNVVNLFESDKLIITPGIVTGGEKLKVINEEVSLKIIETCDKCFLVESIATDYLRNVFDSNNYNYCVCDSFETAYNKAMNSESVKTILIENDITDVYKK